MNAQIPDYRAVYAANPGSCAPCQQAQAAAYRTAPAGKTERSAAIQTPAVQGGTPGAGPASGSAGIPRQPAGLPAAMQQPVLPGGAQGTVPVQPSTPATTGQLMPITDQTQPAPMTAESTEFLNGFLRTQIGREVLVQFLIGTNTFTDRTGTLIGVGANYILLRPANSDDIIACDFFNIKFITFYY